MQPLVPLVFHNLPSLYPLHNDLNPRRACAARVYSVCVCLCVQASHPLLTQLQDQVDIPMDSVSCSLQNNLAFFGVVSKIAIALPYSR